MGQEAEMRNAGGGTGVCEGLSCREHICSRKLLENVVLFSRKQGMFRYERVFRFSYVNLTSGFLKVNGAGLCKAQEAH